MTDGLLVLRYPDYPHSREDVSRMAETVHIAHHDVPYQADIKLARVIDSLGIPCVTEMAHHFAGHF